MKKDANAGVMKYRGYSALIRYSPEDECLVGRVLGINDIVGFHGESVTDMRHELKVAVDSYLADCREMGRAPDRPYSGKMNLRLPATLHQALALQAEATGQSINDLIVAAINSALGRNKRGASPAP